MRLANQGRVSFLQQLNVVELIQHATFEYAQQIKFCMENMTFLKIDWPKLQYHEIVQQIDDIQFKFVTGHVYINTEKNI